MLDTMMTANSVNISTQQVRCCTWHSAWPERTGSSDLQASGMPKQT